MLKYLSLFSGIGSPEQALKNLGVEFELFGFSEIDKYAIKSYCAVHGVDESLNLGDITKIDIESLPLDIDLITHGSPCQDFSVAGNGKGGDLGSGTRSSLMWNTVAICKHCKPKYVIWENVKNVLSKKHKHNYDKYLDSMEALGYTNYAKVINAKSYVPQNRERIFVVSIRNDIKKDFKFPEEKDSGLRLIDILEDNVDEKYYLSDDKVKGLIEEYKGNTIITPCIGASRGRNPENRSDRTVGAPTRQFLEVNTNGTANTLTSVAKDNLVIESKAQSIGNVNPSGRGMNGEVYDANYLSPTLVGKQISNTLTTSCNMTVVVKEDNMEYRIRKLTPKECWRLMGFRDEQFLKAEQVCSNSQLYKQAGNSIVVNVMEEIFKNLI